MSNDPKADLIYAILAMDAYNRGYGSGVTELSDEAGTQLGNYSVTRNADDPGSIAFNAGFYALAYRKAGGTVIAYRGGGGMSKACRPTSWPAAAIR